jgi:hypothetical protein
MFWFVCLLVCLFVCLFVVGWFYFCCFLLGFFGGFFVVFFVGVFKDLPITRVIIDFYDTVSEIKRESNCDEIFVPA